MNTNLIGEQIAKFRKGLGLTQEELGRAVGVSTQAVSRWECGGAPDVTLLPAIADRLDVTVDALFGREGGEVQDMSDTFIHWLRTVPEKDRLTRLTRLLWEAAIYGVSDPLFEAPWIAYPEKGEMEMASLGPGSVLMRTVTGTDGGYILGVGAEDMSFMGVFPEPEEGYEKYLLSDDKYRKLFASLALPGAMEALRYFCRSREGFYVAAVVAERTGVPQAEMERALEAMTEANLLVRQQITLPEGSVNAYVMGDNGGIVAFLYFARWVWQGGHGVNLVGNVIRKRCFDKGEENDEND